MSLIAMDIVMVEDTPREEQLTPTLETPHVAITAQHFAHKAKDAQDAEDTVQPAQAFDEMEGDYGGDERRRWPRRPSWTRGMRKHDP